MEFSLNKFSHFSVMYVYFTIVKSFWKWTVFWSEQNQFYNLKKPLQRKEYRSATKTLIKNSPWHVCEDSWQLAAPPLVWAGGVVCGPREVPSWQVLRGLQHLISCLDQPILLAQSRMRQGSCLGELPFPPNCKLKLPLILLKAGNDLRSHFH